MWPLLARNSLLCRDDAVCLAPSCVNSHSWSALVCSRDGQLVDKILSASMPAPAEEDEGDRVHERRRRAAYVNGNEFCHLVTLVEADALLSRLDSH